MNRNGTSDNWESIGGRFSYGDMKIREIHIYQHTCDDNWGGDIIAAWIR
ncbi:MAG: hypothetical protein HKN34_05305 [Gammaproteobacteria bacterium]|nr:hypothetical protein [Gammaproteobacteria bacterium]